MVRYERVGAAAVLTIDRPERRNAVDGPTAEELKRGYERFVGDEDARVLIITGEGRGFCAGLDLKGAGAPAAAEGLGRPQAGLTGQQHIARLVPPLPSLRLPVIAAVNGPAIGAGLCLAMACDLRYAARGAKLAVPFTSLGMHAGMAATWLLPEIVGLAAARELFFTGRVVDADEALSIGLAEAVLPDDGFLEAAVAWSRGIADRPRPALVAAKRAVTEGLGLALRDGIRLEARLFAECQSDPAALALQDEALRRYRETPPEVTVRF